MTKLFSKNSNLCDHNSPTLQTDRQTTCDRNTALCTKVHRAVKIGENLKINFLGHLREPIWHYVLLMVEGHHVEKFIECSLNDVWKSVSAKNKWKFANHNGLPSCRTIFRIFPITGMGEIRPFKFGTVLAKLVIKFRNRVGAMTLTMIICWLEPSIVNS